MIDDSFARKIFHTHTQAHYNQQLFCFTKQIRPTVVYNKNITHKVIAEQSENKVDLVTLTH